VFVCLCAGQRLDAFTVSTLRGVVEFSAEWMRAESFTSLQVHVTDPRSAFTEAMWSNTEYVDQLLITSPVSASFLFFARNRSTSEESSPSASSTLAVSEDARTFAVVCQGILRARMEALRFPPSLRASWLHRAYFAVEPIQGEHASPCVFQESPRQAMTLVD
jgi:hypothetical protein